MAGVFRLMLSCAVGGLLSCAGAGVVAAPSTIDRPAGATESAVRLISLTSGCPAPSTFVGDVDSGLVACEVPEDFALPVPSLPTLLLYDEASNVCIVDVDFLPPRQGLVSNNCLERQGSGCVILDLIFDPCPL